MTISKGRNKDSLISVFIFKDFKNFLGYFSNTYEEAGFVFKAQGKPKIVYLTKPKNHSHNRKPNKHFNNHLLCPYDVTGNLV